MSSEVSLSSLPPGNIPSPVIRHGRQEWDDRMGDAASRVRRAHALSFALVALLGVSITGNVWQGTQSKIATFVIVKDKVGQIVAVARPDRAVAPDDASVAADLTRWIENVRTIYADADALKHGILSAYDLVRDRSQAVEELNQYYRSNEPFGRARDETVAVSNVTALPVDQTVLTSRSAQMKTYRVQWQEHVTSRDGRALSSTSMWALVTVEWRPPRNEVEVRRSGDGIWVTSFSVSQS
jgi:type IV secretory pathway TrbF-like protein